RPQSRHLINVDWFADAFHSRRAERLERKVTFAEFSGCLARDDRPGACDALQARSEVRRMSDRRVLDLARAGCDRAHHNFAGVYADANLDRCAPFGLELRAIAPQFLLHPQRRVERALRMIFMRDGRAEQREDAVA